MADEVKVKKADKKAEDDLLFNPLLKALRDNDRKNLFKTNVQAAFIKTGFPLIDYYFGAVTNIHDDKGELVKQEPRVGQAAGTFNLIAGASGGGKSMPNWTNIPVPEGGFKRLCEIEKGDYIFDIDGHPTKVLGVYPQSEQQKCYELTVGDRKVCASDDHLWYLIRHDNDQNLVHITTTRNMVERMNDGELGEYFIPNSIYPAEYDDSAGTEEEPDYTFEEHVERICQQISDSIPPSVMYADGEKRWQVLETLFGHTRDEIMDGIISDDALFTTTKEDLFNDLVTFIHSLRLCVDKKTGIDGNGERRCSIMRVWYTEELHITDIEEIEDEWCTCLYVDNPQHVFMAGEFIPTHNTTLASQIAGNMLHQYPYANVIHFDCENRFDVSRAETITRLPAKDFAEDTGRYIIKNGMVGLDTIQKMITDVYKEKMKLKDQLMVDTGVKDEFGKPVMIMMPTIVIIDSITTVMTETFSPDNAKDMAKAEELRSNTEGARDAKTMKGFFKDVIPLCKEANIIIYGINHINTNMSMNSILPVAKQQNFLGQNESIPGGKTMIYYPYNIMKLIPKTTKADRFTEEIDGFNGHLVRIEPIKSSSNQSGNTNNGVAFDMVFSYKQGFDPLRSMILYGKNVGIIEGNRTRMKFRDDPSYTFTFKDVYKQKDEHPIWKDIVKYVIPHLNNQLSYTEPSEMKFDKEMLDY